MKVILCCGSGASSGFMATSIKKAAKKRGIEMDVFARGESLLESYLDDCDAVMIAPHLVAEKDEIAKRCGDVPAEVISRSAYGMLDGDAVLNQILQIVKK